MKMNFKRNVWIGLILVLAIIVRIVFEIIIRTFRIDYSFANFLLQFLRYFVRFIAVLIWLRIVYKSEYTINKLPWLLFLILDPLTGTVFFLTFGRDFRESYRYASHPLMQDGQYLTHEPLTNFNNALLSKMDTEITDIYKTAYNITHHHVYQHDSQVTPITKGDVFFNELESHILKARSFILFQTYILRTDDTGKRILHALKQKAEEGVEIYLLYDAVGSVFLDRKLMKALKESGVIVHPIDSVYFGFFDTRITYRNHRKVCIIDGETAFLGGMNIADEYQNQSKKFPPFRDTQLKIKGQVINSLVQLFFKDYYYVTDTLIDDDRFYNAKRVSSNGLVQVIPSGPDDKYPPIRNVYVKMINNAKASIKIMTPYLALDNELATSLIIAARGGVKVDIIVPGIPDKKSVYMVTQSFFDELLQEGINIHLYNDAFCHAKVFIIDDRLASCGTYNFDNRSARSNFEVTMLLYQTGVEALVEAFNLDLQNATKVIENEWENKSMFKRLLLGIMNLFAPLV
ncbi:MAG: cardiolipin synthase [Candidatus Izemoplasma sp.]|nr:cardiolipin synthase [Candidatus Izemoplasma sp.]